MPRETRIGLRCPHCKGTRTSAQRTVANIDHSVLYRERQCNGCGQSFSTFESTQPLTNITRSIRRAEDLIRRLQNELRRYKG